jgi:branched-chain amino acid transport system ATP-binding protein
MEPILEMRNVSKSFGGLLAVHNVSFSAIPGEIKAIIGPNGAGKTTLFHLVMGVLKLSSGEILFKERKLEKLKPFEVAALGIARTFQNVRLFGELTVIENVMLGVQYKNMPGFLNSGTRGYKIRGEKEAFQKSEEALEFVKADHNMFKEAESLPFGTQRLVEIARAIVSEPELLLLDEPAAGLNTHEVAVMKQMIFKIRERGINILLIEHDMNLVMDVSDSVMVLNYGEKIADDTPLEIRKNKKVIDSYLGYEIEVA